MKIINDNKKHKCIKCRQEITTKRKVRWSKRTYLHISCCYNYALEKFYYWRKIKNQLSKYTKEMVIEKLK